MVPEKSSDVDRRSKHLPIAEDGLYDGTHSPPISDARGAGNYSADAALRATIGA